MKSLLLLLCLSVSALGGPKAKINPRIYVAIGDVRKSTEANGTQWYVFTCINGKKETIVVGVREDYIRAIVDDQAKLSIRYK